MIYEVPDELQKILNLADSDAAKKKVARPISQARRSTTSWHLHWKITQQQKDKLEEYMGKKAGQP